MRSRTLPFEKERKIANGGNPPTLLFSFSSFFILPGGKGIVKENAERTAE